MATVRAQFVATRTQQIVEAVERLFRATGIPPTVREVCKETGIKDTSTVHGYMLRAIAKGALTRKGGSGQNRSIMPAQGCCPTCGREWER